MSDIPALETAVVSRQELAANTALAHLVHHATSLLLRQGDRGAADAVDLETTFRLARHALQVEAAGRAERMASAARQAPRTQP